MKEWSKEEEEAALELMEEQKKMIGMLTTLNASDERVKDLCRPWKNAIILIILGRKTNIDMLKDIIKWLLRSENFELIDLPNNYFVFRITKEALCNKLLFDEPWQLGFYKDTTLLVRVPSPVATHGHRGLPSALPGAPPPRSRFLASRPSEREWKRSCSRATSAQRLPPRYQFSRSLHHRLDL
ncbi:hypothetical protein K1719_023502 [Acacia pycnantha]|nr:hypothetical protein K1719_023502 [Acacia pycnantha]